MNTKIMTKNKKHECLSWFLLYTVSFLLIATIILFFFYSQGKIPIRMKDAVAQHFPSLCYTGDYLRNLFANGFLSVPMVDFSVGQGFDVIGTLNYYGLGDPLNILTVFFPDGAEETMYVFMMFLHIYLSGAAFAVYCAQISKKEKIYVLIGTLLYAFCNFTLLGGIKHPFFLNGLLYLPLLLAGVERIVQKKGILLLAVVSGLAFMSNYYFMYMNTILAGIYFLIRLFGQYKELQIKGFLMLVGKIIGAYIWGVCLAGVILFPSVYAFLNNARESSQSAEAGLVYSSGYYTHLIKSLTLSSGARRTWILPGTGVIGLISVFLMFVRRSKKDIWLMIGFIVLIVMLCFPFIGKAMNGFAYPSNRWSYGVAFLMALMSVFQLPYLISLSKRQVLVLGGVMGVYTAVLLIIGETNSLKIVILIAIFLFCLLYQYIRTKWNHRALVSLLGVVTIFSVIINAAYLYFPYFNNISEDYRDIGSMNGRYSNSAQQILNEIDDDSFYRTECQWDHDLNHSLLTGNYVTNFYYSIVPKTTSNLYQGVCLTTNDKLPMLSNLDSRTVLNAIASVKYYATKKEENIPYGYDKIKETVGADGNTRYLYENQNALPLGYTYDQIMLKDDYNALTPLEKERVLLDVAVVDQEKEQMDTVTKAADYGIITKTVLTESNKLAGAAGETQTRTFEGVEECETYLNISKLRLTRQGRSAIWFKTDDSKSLLKMGDEEANSYINRDQILIHLGYHDQKLDSCELNYKYQTKSKFDVLEVQCLPMKGIPEAIQERKKESLEDIKVTTNKITGKITTTGNKILQLSIPYSKGWKASVDGKRVKTFTSSVAYTGIWLEAGEHEITLQYISPGITPGIIGTLGAILAIVIYSIYQYKKKKAVK